MSDYIKREDAIEQARRNWTGEGEWIASTEIQLLKNLPSADVVEVVRCKDCKHYKRNIPCVGGHYNGCDEWLDEGNAITVYDNDFCSFGERADT